MLVWIGVDMDLDLEKYGSEIVLGVGCGLDFFDIDFGFVVLMDFCEEKLLERFSDFDWMEFDFLDLF